MRRSVSERAQVSSSSSWLCGVAAADQRPNRSADDNVGNDVALEQRLNNADMGEAARRAAAEHQSNQRPAVLALYGFGSYVSNRHLALDLGPARKGYPTMHDQSHYER